MQLITAQEAGEILGRSVYTITTYASKKLHNFPEPEQKQKYNLWDKEKIIAWGKWNKAPIGTKLVTTWQDFI